MTLDINIFTNRIFSTMKKYDIKDNGIWVENGQHVKIALKHLYLATFLSIYYQRYRALDIFNSAYVFSSLLREEIA